MWRYIVSRLLSAMLVILGVSCLVFFLIHLVPGDPVEIMLGESARPADREALRHALGLHLPVWQQLGHYLSDLVQLDLGKSLHSQRAITELLTERLPATLELAATSLLIAILFALPLGSIAAVRKDTAADYSAMTLSLLGISIPNFVMGPVLILVFSIGLGWLPVSGREASGALVLPAFTLGTALAAVLTRMVRASLLEVLQDDYIRTARAKGLTHLQVLLHHALPNAMLPVITLIGLQLGALLAGAVITEVVFSWPGIGTLTIEAIHKRDYPVLQACVLIISIGYVLVNTATDMLYARLDPRLRGVK